MKFFSWSLLYLLVNSVVIRVESVRCHSCFSACSDPSSSTCNCAEGECHSDYCFARLIPFEGESHLAVSKGCTTDNILSLQKTICIRGDDNSLDCLCTQPDFCNDAVPTGYTIKPANFDCCSQGRDDIGNCASTCRGAYCYDDRLSVEKGCGHGRSGLVKMLNIQVDVNEIKSLCAELFYDSPTKTYLQNGCICTGWRCNYKLTPMGFHRAKVLCHSCIISGKLGDPDYINTCNKRGRCVGNFCFLQYRTEDITQAYVDDSEDRYEAPRLETTSIAYFGCLNMESKAMGLVQRGCLQEFSDGQKLTYEQCICDSHLCNSPDVVTNSSIVVGTLKNGYVLPSTDEIGILSLPTRRPGAVNRDEKTVMIEPTQTEHSPQDIYTEEITAPMPTEKSAVRQVLEEPKVAKQNDANLFSISLLLLLISLVL